MSLSGAIDVPVEIIGGLVCDMAPSEVPAGVSIDCADVIFAESSVRTRPGLGAPLVALTGPYVTYLKTFITSSGTLRALALDSLANLWRESSVAVATTYPLFSAQGQFSFVQWFTSGTGGAAVPPPGAVITVTGAANPHFNGTFTVISSSQSSSSFFTALVAPIFTGDSTGQAGIITYTTIPIGFSIIQTVADAIVSGNIPYANSTTLFGREFIALSDGQNGTGLPRQFDDTNLDRVSQSGPGAAPQVADENVSYNIATAPTGLGMQSNSIAASGGASQIGNTVTITISSAANQNTVGLQVGTTVSISGFTATGYNGTFLVSAIPSSSSFQYINNVAGLPAEAGGGGHAVSYNLAVVTIASGTFPSSLVGLSMTISGAGVGGYNGTWTVNFIPGLGGSFLIVQGPAIGLGTSGGGAIAIAGNISAGKHMLTVVFVTRNQFITAPAPPFTWNAAGGRRALVTNIPTGPANIIQRILLFTPAASSHFYYLTGVPQIPTSNFVIPDNVTTSLTVDFSDQILQAGTLSDYLFNQVILGECAGVIDYSQRLFWWGERNKVQNFVNMDFDGGWGPTSFSPFGFPLGWTQNYFSANQGIRSQASVSGDAFSITYTGPTGPGQPVTGQIQQGAYQDWRGVNILQSNTQYSVRIRLSNPSGPGAVPNTFVAVDVFSPTGGGVLGQFNVVCTTITPAFTEFSGSLLQPQVNIPTDAVLRLYLIGTCTVGYNVVADCLEVFPTSTPNNPSLVRASRAQNQESYDGVTGLLLPVANNGQAVRSAFRLRERLYFVKERSLYVTQDDYANEPAQWTISEVSPRVGTPSVRGVGLGEDWAVIAAREGLYITRGGEPVKISQEIGHSASGFTLAWDQINWKYGFTLWVVVDTLEKRIYVGAPFGVATTPNAVLMLDYRDIDSEQGIEQSPPIRVSYRGIKVVSDKSRKWSPWKIAMMSCALIERTDGTAHLWMGSGNGSVPAQDAGAIYDVQATNLTDYSTLAQIPGYYTTSFVPQREANQAAQMDEHRKLFTYMTMFVEGSGRLNVSAYPDSQSFNIPLPSLYLTTPANGDTETTIRVTGERIAFNFSPTGAAAWFRLQKLSLAVKGDPWAPVRGT